MEINLTKPCNQCPFRRNSLPGWLGPWKAEEIVWSLGRAAFPCHKTIRQDRQSIKDSELEGCAGASIFLNNKAERSRNLNTLQHQQRVRNINKDIKKSVFSGSQEFIKHHNPIFNEGY